MESRQIAQLQPGVSIDRWTPSICGMCPVGCGLSIAVSDNRIVGVKGRVDYSTGRGRLGPKGLEQLDQASAPARVTQPLLRDALGRLTPASWDEALDRIVDRFNEVLAVEGPSAVGFLAGQLYLEEYYALARLARAAIGTPHLAAAPGPEAAWAAAQRHCLGMEGNAGSLADLEATRCILLLDADPAEDNAVLWMRILAAKDGPHRPRVIVIDSRRTFTVESGADLHLRPEPGTATALLSVLCQAIIQHGWIDPDFIARHTRGYDPLRAAISESSPEAGQALCGVAADDLRQAAGWIGEAGSLVTLVGSGPAQGRRGLEAAGLIHNLHLLTGRIGRPGSGPLFVSGQAGAANARETGVNGGLPGFRSPASTVHRKELERLWGVPAELLGEAATPATDMLELYRAGRIKVLWSVGAGQEERGAFGFLIAQQPHLDEETARVADVVLPTAGWGEKTGCLTNLERRCGLLEKAVEPPGQGRSDLDILVDFARRMDFRDDSDRLHLDFATPEQAFAEWREVSRGTPCDYSGMDYSRLRTSGLQWPCNAGHTDGSSRLYEDLHFPTGPHRARFFVMEPTREHHDNRRGQASTPALESEYEHSSRSEV